MAEMLPRPPVTRNQVELMEIDSVVSLACPGFRDLGIEPQDIDVVLAAPAGASTGRPVSTA